MSNFKNRIDEYLLAVKLIIDNALSDPQLKEVLARYGYSAEKLAAGKKLYDETVALHHKQLKEYDEQAAAASELNEAWDTADKHYMNTLKIARVAFSDNAKAEKALMIHEVRKQSLPGWLDQAKVFYAGLVSDGELVRILSKYDYTLDKLQQEFALVYKVVAQYIKQKKEQGAIPEAVQARDHALDELAQWISDLKKVAEIALKGNPGQLERLNTLA